MTKDLILRFYREVWLSFIIRDVMLAQRDDDGRTHRAPLVRACF